jgi:hypothetical protein
LSDNARLQIRPAVTSGADFGSPYLYWDALEDRFSVDEATQMRIEMGFFPAGIIIIPFNIAACNYLIVRNPEPVTVLMQYNNTAGTNVTCFVGPGDIYVIPDFNPLTSLLFTSLDVERRVDLLVVGT